MLGNNTVDIQNKNSKNGLKEKRFKSLYSKKYLLLFALCFGIFGVLLTTFLLAATTSVSYSGSLTQNTPQAKYAITTGSGQLTAKLSTRSKDLTMTIRNSSGTTLATVSNSGVRSVTASVSVTPGTYSVTVSYNGTLTTRKRFSLNLSYPLSDTTNPTAVITSPLSQASVSGTVDFAASATDNIAITKVEFFVGSNLLATDTTSPYSTPWDTTKTPNGSTNLTIKSYDSSNNIGTASGTVTVSNTVATTPPPTESCPAGQTGTPPNCVTPTTTPTDFCSVFPALPSAKPVANNTGVPAGVTLTNSGSISVTTAGTVVEGKNVTGAIDVKASNVTIKNSRVNSTGYFGINIASNVTGIKILNSEIYAPGPNGNYIGINGNANGTIICGNYLHGFENAMTINGSSNMIQANFIEKLHYVTSPAPHYDGIEIYGGNNHRLWGNNILMTDLNGAWLGDTGAINTTAYGGTNIDNVELNGNWMGGGSNTLNLDQQDTSKLTNVKVTNNRFYGSAPKGFALFGPCRCGDPAPTVWTGNVWDANGTAVSY